MAAGISEFKHDWEPEYLEMTRDFIFQQHLQGHRDDRRRRSASRAPASSSSATTSASSTRSRTSSSAASSSRRCSCSSIFGILGGIGPDVENLLHMKSDGRPPVRRRLPPGRSSAPGATRRTSSPSGRSWAATCASAWRTASTCRAGQARREQRRAGGEDRPHPRRAVARGRHAGRGARDARAQGPGRDEDPGRLDRLGQRLPGVGHERGGLAAGRIGIEVPARDVREFSMTIRQRS